MKTNHYLPDFKKPKTYNEKRNLRKRDPKHPLFSICADKIRAKEYVAEKIGQEIIIPNYYVGENIDFDTMKQIIEEKGDCFRSEEHTSELQSRGHLVCRLLLEKKKKQKKQERQRAKKR